MHRTIGLTLAFWIISASGASTAVGGTREWRDTTGQYSRQAEFVALRDGEVHLKLVDGRAAKVSLNKLSTADQKFVADATKPKIADPFVTLASSEVKMVQAVLQSERVAQAETIPPPDASTTFAAMQDPEAAAGEEAVDYRRIRKFVYYGCHSTTHLIDLSDRRGYGTIHYCWHDHHHHHHDCCGPHCTWHLAYLRKYGQSNDFFYYTPYYSAPDIDMWAFAKYPTRWACKYRIWYRDTNTKKWYRFDWASRVHPK